MHGHVPISLLFSFFYKAEVQIKVDLLSHCKNYSIVSVFIQWTSHFNFLYFKGEVLHQVPV